MSRRYTRVRVLAVGRAVAARSAVPTRLAVPAHPTVATGPTAAFGMTVARFATAGLLAVACFAALALTACESTDPGGSTRFGQTGEISVAVDKPLHLGLGRLHQQVDWESGGRWSIHEEISYRNASGDQDLRLNPGLPTHYAGSYASVVQYLNDNPAVKLIGVDELADTECDTDRTRVTVMIADANREERRTWTRCTYGTLSSLTATGSGPDVDAARVIEVAIRVRDVTVGNAFRSAYLGSLPFSTIEKGTQTGWAQDSSVVFRAPDEGPPDETQAAWGSFWNAHRSTSAARPPAVDWEREMVLAGMIGVRHEVGDSAEVRRVITGAEGTRVDLYERIPGDFCAPAERTVRPFHIVVVPKAPAPVFFGVLKQEWVPCGTS